MGQMTRITVIKKNKKKFKTHSYVWSEFFLIKFELFTIQSST